MDFSIKQLGLIVIAIAAILATVALVQSVVTKTGEAVDDQMDQLAPSTSYVLPADNGFENVVYYA